MTVALTTTRNLVHSTFSYLVYQWCYTDRVYITTISKIVVDVLFSTEKQIKYKVLQIGRT